MKPTIGIAAPADFLFQKDLDTGLSMLQSADCNVVVAPQVTIPFGRMAGEDFTRAQALQGISTNSSISSVIFAKGGYGCSRILPLVEWQKLRAQPTWMGFSDTTALLNARVAQCGQMNWHGPMVMQISQNPDRDDNKIALDILKGIFPKSYGQQHWPQAQILQKGSVRGRLLGGNLSMFRTLLGTPFAPKPQQGDILFFEEICETNYRIDRDLEHLAQAGWFDMAGGIIWGRFSDIEDSTSRPFGFSTEQILERASSRIKGPVIYNAEIGHAGPNFPVPVGGVIHLHADNTFTLNMEIDA